MSTIKENVLNVLAECTVTGNVVFLPNQMDRKLYVEVNKVLEGLGGKWSRKDKGHVFGEDPQDVLDSAISTGEYVSVRDWLKETNFFPTPEKIVKKMLDLANISDNHRVLEPSAGSGAIADLIPDKKRVTCVELDEDLAGVLRKKGYTVFQMDFLKYEGLYDRIVMNPPFRNQQDIDHVFHAYESLDNGGRLVAVVSESCFFRDNLKAAKFRTFLKSVNATVVELNHGDFKESGTMVKTKIVAFDRH